MSSSEVEADTDEVVAAVESYRSALQALDDRGAVEQAESLTEVDCEVCQQIGQYLGGLGVAVVSAPGDKHREATRERALAAAQSVLDDVAE
jgi:hypothetical protein